MDKDRRPCNRATCGNKMKCGQMSKETKRCPQASSTPGGQPAKNASPNAGNSTQILYVEPNFTETPSEYDVFYDCFSDVEISQASAAVCHKRGPSASPPVKDSIMFRDALKQVIVTAQTLLGEFEGSGRKERRWCGSRCRCDVRNIKPQSRTVQLEVTAKVAANKTNDSPNIRIDPITFTIPLKLHLQGQHLPNVPNAESQQPYEMRPLHAMQEQDQISKLFSSIEPIRTATVTAPRPEVSSIPMEGPGQALNFQSALLQQMVGMQPGFLPFPFEGANSFPMQTPSGKGVSSKVQIQVPPSPPLMTLGRPEVGEASKTKAACGEVCTIERQQASSFEQFLSPSLAPVTRGPFLATIATSSVPSMVASKSQQLSETASQGVCVLCGRGGEHSHTQPKSSNKAACGMCSKGKFVPPQPSEFPSHLQKKGACGKCSKPQISLIVLVPPAQKSTVPNNVADTTLAVNISEVGNVTSTCKTCSLGAPPSLPKLKEPSEKKSCGAICAKESSAPSQPSAKGPCGMCTRRPPPPPPLQEPLLNLKGPCGKCSKVEPLITKETPTVKKELLQDLMCAKSEPSVLLKVKPCGACTNSTPKNIGQEKIQLETATPIVKDTKRPCSVCSKGPKVQVNAQIAPSGICSQASVELSKADNAICDICSKGAAAPPKAERDPCRTSSSSPFMTMKSEKVPCVVCSGRVDAPTKTEQPPYTMGSRGGDALAKTGNVPCAICSRGVEAPVSACKASVIAAEPAATQKTLCGICSRGATAAAEVAPAKIEEIASSGKFIKEMGPCGICSTGLAAYIETESASCGIYSRAAAPQSEAEIGPCGICSRAAAPQLEAETGPCGICSRAAAPQLEVETGPSGICSRAVAPQPEAEIGPCGICSRAPAPKLESEVGPCGICSRAAAPKPEAEVGPCGICSRGAPVQLETEVGPCGICSKGGAPTVAENRASCGICSRGHTVRTQEVKGPCGICRKEQALPLSKLETEVKGPCNICKKSQTPSAKDESRGVCGICKKIRAPEEIIKNGSCGICTKPTSPGSEPLKIQPCGKCSSVGAPCRICAQNTTENIHTENAISTESPCGICKAPTAAAPTNVYQSCGTCLGPLPGPANIRQCGTCMPPTKPTNCGTCLVTPPTVVDRTCGTCLMPKPAETPIEPIEVVVEPKYYKALPQHKDIHICSPCRYDPSPLIDAEGNVFCPHNCGCCLCPWRKRATDSQIDQIKHEKIKVCKCRMKGSIFADYTSRAKCSNTSYFDCCPCRERAEAKYLEMTGEEMWSPDDRMADRVRGDPVNIEDVIEYKRTSTIL